MEESCDKYQCTCYVRTRTGNDVRKTGSGVTWLRRRGECVLFVVFVVLLEVLQGVGGVKLPDVYWNTTNNIFWVDNTDHVLDIGIGDTLNIVCPKYSEDQPQHMETPTIYQVTKDEYDNCRVYLGHKKSRKILACDKPLEDKMYTIVFRSFTPLPQGLEFKRGQDYYYISTSGDGVDKGEASCKKYNMRLIFKVCCSVTQAPPTLPPPPPEPNRNSVRHSSQHQGHRHTLADGDGITSLVPTSLSSSSSQPSSGARSALPRDEVENHQNFPKPEILQYTDSGSPVAFSWFLQVSLLSLSFLIVTICTTPTSR